MAAALTNTGIIDINGFAILDYTLGNSPIATIRAQAQQGFASATWTGGGMTSTAAAGVALDGSNIHKTAVGYAEASHLGIGTFANQSVGSTSLVMRYTLSGDATLDGAVNSSDFNALSLSYNQSGKFWSNGDFNYDGTVNALDFNAFATNFGAPLMGLPVPGLRALIPEPATMLYFALAATLAPRRRFRCAQSSSFAWR